VVLTGTQVEFGSSYDERWSGAERCCFPGRILHLLLR